jgi:hypothetical protein
MTAGELLFHCISGKVFFYKGVGDQKWSILKRKSKTKINLGRKVSLHTPQLKGVEHRTVSTQQPLP